MNILLCIWRTPIVVVVAGAATIAVLVINIMGEHLPHSSDDIVKDTVSVQ